MVEIEIHTIYKREKSQSGAGKAFRVHHYYQSIMPVGFCVQILGHVL